MTQTPGESGWAWGPQCSLRYSCPSSHTAQPGPEASCRSCRWRLTRQAKGGLRKTSTHSDHQLTDCGQIERRQKHRFPECADFPHTHKKTLHQNQLERHWISGTLRPLGHSAYNHRKSPEQYCRTTARFTRPPSVKPINISATWYFRLDSESNLWVRTILAFLLEPPPHSAICTAHYPLSADLRTVGNVQASGHIQPLKSFGRWDSKWPLVE